MRIVITDDDGALSRAAADLVAAVIAANPTARIVLATGETPIGLYRELAARRRRGELDASHLRIFQLDAYLGLAPDDRRSLYRWMKESVLDPLGVPEQNVVRLPGDAPNPEATCRAYEQAVHEAGGFDLAVLGLGLNGHLGFNEPPADPQSPTRVVDLSEESIASNARYWGGRDQVPRQALTAGMAVLLAARQTLLVVSGEHKCDILRRTLQGPITPGVPASYLQQVSNVTVIVDRAAEAGLQPPSADPTMSAGERAQLTFGAHTTHVTSRSHLTEHQHAGIEVIGVRQGRLALAAAGGLWYADAGQVVVVPPHLPHRGLTQHEADLAVIVIHLAAVPQDLADRLLLGRRPRVISLVPTQFAEYEALFTRLATTSGQVALEQARLLRAYLEAFLLVLLKGIQEQDPAAAAMHEAAAYLRAHLGEPVTVSALARLFFMSEATLRRRFRATFGTAPKQYVLDLRLAAARDLLATSHLSVQEVAERMGFFNLAHFSTAFHRRYGLSPSQWRNSNQT